MQIILSRVYAAEDHRGTAIGRVAHCSTRGRARSPLSRAGCVAGERTRTEAEEGNSGGWLKGEQGVFSEATRLGVVLTKG